MFGRCIGLQTLAGKPLGSLLFHTLLLLLLTLQAYSLKAYDIPEGSRTAQGTAITQVRPTRTHAHIHALPGPPAAGHLPPAFPPTWPPTHPPARPSTYLPKTPARPPARLPARQVLPIDRSTAIAAMLPVSGFSADTYLAMLTAGGQLKRTALEQFSKINSRGLGAMKIQVCEPGRWGGAGGSAPPDLQPAAVSRAGGCPPPGVQDSAKSRCVPLLGWGWGWRDAVVGRAAVHPCWCPGGVF